MVEENRLGQLLKTSRVDLGLKQSDVADALFISDKAYSKIETGINGLSSLHIPKLCKTLHIGPRTMLSAVFGSDVLDEVSKFDHKEYPTGDAGVVYHDFRMLAPDDMTVISHKEHIMRICLLSGIVAHRLNFDAFRIYADDEELYVELYFDVRKQFELYSKFREPFGPKQDAMSRFSRIVDHVHKCSLDVVDVVDTVSRSELVYIDSLINCNIDGHDKVVELLDHYTVDYHLIQEYLAVCINSHSCLWNVMVALLDHLKLKYGIMYEEDISKVSGDVIMDYVLGHEDFKHYESEFLPKFYDLIPKLKHWSDRLFSLTMDVMSVI